MPDWPEILSRDGPGVWRAAYRLVGSRADADDCYQEAFLAALEVSKREEVRHWPGLLRRLVTARALDRLRRRRRRGEVAGGTDAWDGLADPAAPSVASSDDLELSARLREALAAIPPRQAEVFCLQVVEGWSYREIAEGLGVSVDAVGVLVHRARAGLRRLLDPTSARKEAR